MASQGPNSPGTMANNNSSGTYAWSNVDNAKTSDNSYSSSTASKSAETTQILVASNFGFTVPTGATINGVTVAIERKASLSDGNFWYARDNLLKLVKGGSLSGDNKAATSTNWPTSDGTASYGGASDLWGNTLTAEDVNASNFGCALQAVYKGTVPKIYNAPFVDHITITVAYTESGGASGVPKQQMHYARQRR